MNSDLSPPSGAGSVALRVLVPIGIVVLGLVVVAAMVFLTPRAERVSPEATPLRVEVIEVHPEDAVAKVYATGLVQPARQVTLTPQVSGRIVWQSDQLVPGGRIQKGHALAQIEPTEYELKVEQAKSTVRAAELELELERGRQRVAAREWALLGEGRSAEDADLALRKPQLVAAEQSLAAARSGLEQAELNLQRTLLIAPFNAMILEESVDVGQVVGLSSPVATLVGTDEAWVKVSIPVDQLPMVRFPVGDVPGSSSRVLQRLGAGTSIVRDGAVAQLLAQLDPQTRTAQLLVVVAEPARSDTGELPLLPGAYVDVTIDGRVLEQVYAIPRTALDGADKVWIVERQDVLASRRVEIGWRDAEKVVLTAGLEPGARVVVSPLALPIEGMQVQAVVRDPTADETADAAPEVR